MEKIENFNCDRKCCEKLCDRAYTRFVTIDLLGMKVHLCFCDSHASQFDSAYSKIREEKCL